MQLYFTPGTISIAVAIALEEAGLPYESVQVDFASAERPSPPITRSIQKAVYPHLWSKVAF
jgi:glutathione S-transferase